MSWSLDVKEMSWVHSSGSRRRKTSPARAIRRSASPRRAIGYFETEEENLRLFDVIAAALKPGGTHVLAVCSADHARQHFPRRHWEAGAKRLSLADFRWKERESRMIYRGHHLSYGEPLPAIPDAFPEDGQKGTRLYGLAELEGILSARGLEVLNAFGGYDVKVPASPDRLLLVVVSRKRRRA